MLIDVSNAPEATCTHRYCFFCFFFISRRIYNRMQMECVSDMLRDILKLISRNHFFFFFILQVGRNLLFKKLIVS